MTQELTQLPIGLSFLTNGILLGAVSLLDRLLHGNPGPFRLVFGFGNSFIQPRHFTTCGCLLLLCQAVDVELDDAVSERCGLLGARRCEGDGNDASAALLECSGVAFELFEGPRSRCSAPAEQCKPG